MDKVPEDFQWGRRVLEQHRHDCAPYSNSYEAASQGITRQMKRYNSAWKFPEILPCQEGVMLQNQLLTSNVCPTVDTKRIFRETACRLEPYGCVTARVCNFESGKYYIVLDTGAGDFFGNMASMLVALYEQRLGHGDFGLDKQALVSKFWGLALIYYDYGFKTNNEALLYPHFKYDKLNSKAQPYARLLSHAARPCRLTPKERGHPDCHKQVEQLAA